jgi:monoterpene epsilon-lactone hydrolase
MTKSDLSNYIANRFYDVVISGHAIAVKIRREVVGATPQQIRTAIEGLSRMNPGLFGGSLSYSKIAGIKCGIVIYNNISERKVLWIHGGAFAFGSARVYKATAVNLAKAIKCEVVIPDYVLSPEVQYPDAFNEIFKVYCELIKNGDNVDLIGDSAGGNLAACIVQRCVREGVTVPGKLVLLSPWLDLSKRSKSNDLNYSEFSPFDNLDTVSYGREYMGDLDEKDPRVSPIYGDFTGFPNTHFQSSKVEFLYNDTLSGIEALEATGCELSTHFEEKALHGWHLVPDFLPEAKRSMKAVAEFLKP